MTNTDRMELLRLADTTGDAYGRRAAQAVLAGDDDALLDLLRNIVHVRFGHLATEPRTP